MHNLLFEIVRNLVRFWKVFNSFIFSDLIDFGHIFFLILSLAVAFTMQEFTIKHE
jgi:hypothetical protein